MVNKKSLSEYRESLWILYWLKCSPVFVGVAVDPRGLLSEDTVESAVCCAACGAVLCVLLWILCRLLLCLISFKFSRLTSNRTGSTFRSLSSASPSDYFFSALHFRVSLPAELPGVWSCPLPPVFSSSSHIFYKH